jgi:hypothetical protein
MASCVTLFLYYKVVFLDFCLEYKHNNGMTLKAFFTIKTIVITIALINSHDFSLNGHDY